MPRPAAKARAGLWFIVSFLPPAGRAVYLAKGGGYTHKKMGAKRFSLKADATAAARAIPARLQHPFFAPAISRTSKP